MKNEFKTNEYKIVKKDGMIYLYLTKELNNTLLENKELDELMIKLIKQNNVQKIIVD